MTSTNQVILTVPEPDLHPDDLVSRARDLRPRLLNEQDATEARGAYSAEMHELFTQAGFYRTLQPRRFGGYEFDVPTFLRLIIEIARGCPSTGWCLCLAAGHALQLGGLFSESAQIEALSPDGHFAAPARGIPMGTAKRVEAGWQIDGTWDYCSGSPYSTHAMVAVRMVSGDAPPVIGLALVPRKDWTPLDDWRDVAFGMRGSGSNSILIDGAIVPEHFVIDENLLATKTTTDTPGYRLHGNPMYAGNALGYLQLEITAILIGTARAALDEYERIITTKKTAGPAGVLRSETADYRRWYGLALGKIDAAEDILIRSGEAFMRSCREATEHNSDFVTEEGMRLNSATHHAVNLGWEAVELIYRTSGTSEGGRKASRIVRYYRDYSTARTNIGLQYEPYAERLSGVHFEA